MPDEEAKRPGCPELTRGYVEGVAKALGRSWALVITDNGDGSQVVGWGRAPADLAAAASLAARIALSSPRELARAARVEAALRAMLEECDTALSRLAVVGIAPGRLGKAVEAARAALEGKDAQADG